MTDYDAALRAARERIRQRVVEYALWIEEHPDEDDAVCDAVDVALYAYEALAKAVGAAEEHAQHVTFAHPNYCAACHEVGPCEVEAEADRLAAPYLPEVKA